MFGVSTNLTVFSLSTGQKISRIVSTSSSTTTKVDSLSIDVAPDDASGTVVATRRFGNASATTGKSIGLLDIAPGDYLTKISGQYNTTGITTLSFQTRKGKTMTCGTSVPVESGGTAFAITAPTGQQIAGFSVSASKTSVDGIGVAKFAAAKAEPPAWNLSGPSIVGDSYQPLFKNGIMFAIFVNGKRDYYVYNDSQESEFYGTYTFSADAKVSLLPGCTKATLVQDATSKKWVATIGSVFPGETVPFFSFVSGSWSASYGYKYSTAYAEQYKSIAAAKVQAEIARCASIAASTDAEATLSACVASSVPFVDPVFPPADASLNRSWEKQLTSRAWERPTDFLPASQWDTICLADGIDPNDIDQGALGDCWFLAAVAAVAEFPDRIHDIFRSDKDEAKTNAERAVGAYRATLNKHGWWQIVIVDNYLPTSARRPVFTDQNEQRGELWSALLEKAFAKVHGSYAAIEGGDPLDALQDLSGSPVLRLDLTKARADATMKEAFFQQLLDFDQRNYLMSLTINTGNDTQTSSVGLVQGHAYSLLAAKHFPSRDLRLVKVRNPWGNEVEWTGKWADKDPVWSDASYQDVTSQLCGTRGADGCFWMTWDDCVANFSTAGACMTETGWADYRVQGQFVSRIPNVALEVWNTSSKPFTANIVLSQRDRRGAPPDSPDRTYEALLLSLSAPVSATQQRFTMNSGSKGAAVPATDPWMYMYSRDVVVRYTFAPSPHPYVIVPRAYTAGSAKPFVLGFISDTALDNATRKVNLKKLPNDSGAFGNSYVWNYSPSATSGPNSSTLVTTQVQRNLDTTLPTTSVGSSF